MQGAVNGTVNFNGAVVTFTPVANFHGDAGFSYTMRDAAGELSSAGVSVRVNSVNDVPQAVSLTTTTISENNSGGSLGYGAPGNSVFDADDGETIHLLSFAGQPFTPGMTIAAQHGTLAPREFGMLDRVFGPAFSHFFGWGFDYVPNQAHLDAIGLAEGQIVNEVFSYVVVDNAGATASATVTIPIRGTNDNPVANADSVSTNEDTPIAGNVLANDYDLDNGDVLAVTNFGALTSARGAIVALNADGSYTYDSRSAATLQALNNGQSLDDSFGYIVSDGHGGTANGTVTIHATGAADNSAPVAVDEQYATSEDTPFAIGASGIGAPGGLVTVNFDNIGGGAEIRTQYQPLGVVFSTSAGIFQAGGSLESISSPNSAVFYNPSDQRVVTSVFADFVDPASGKPSSTNYVEFTPTDASAPTTFFLRAFDINGNFLEAVLESVESTGVYSPAEDHTVAISRPGIHRVEMSGMLPAGGSFVIEGDNFRFNAPGRLGVLANDSDAEGSVLTALLVQAPANGSLALGSSGTFTYTPNANFFGTDTFLYRASDGTDSSGAATVTVTVAPENDAPVALNSIIATNAGTPDKK